MAGLVMRRTLGVGMALGLLTGSALAQQESPVGVLGDSIIQHQPQYPAVGYGFVGEQPSAGWDWELEFVPQAGRADSKKIAFARVDDGQLRVISSDLYMSRLQKRLLIYPSWASHPPVPVPYESPRIFGTPNGWVVTENGEGILVSGVEGEAPSPELFRSLGLQQIEEIFLAEGRLFVRGRGLDALGGEEDALWHAPNSLPQPPEDWKRLPAPPGDLQDFGWLVSNGRVVLVGGNEKGMPPSRTVFSHLLGGADEGWRPLMYSLPTAPGPTRGLALNSLAVAMPASPSGDSNGEWPPQRVHWAHDRADAGGTIDEWITYTYDFPAPVDPVVFVIPEAQIIVFAGGVDGVGGEPLASARLRPARETNQYRFLVNPPRLPDRNQLGIPIPRKNQITFAHYQTALKRARSQGKHHVVFVLDEKTYNDEESRHRFLRDTAVIPMLQDFVVSTPWPDDLPGVRKLIGTSEWPAVALLDSRGQLVDVFEGIPNREQMFQFLLPAWGPQAVAAPGYIPTAP